MAASYPSSIVVLSTKNDGDTIFASHVDSLQDETIAIETGLLNGFQHSLLPFANNTYDLGSDAKRWANGNFQALKVAGVAIASSTDIGVMQLRLSLTTATPVTSADVTAATTLFLTPYKGNRIAVYDSAGVPSVLTSAEISIAVPASTSQMYDVFVFSSAGVATLELLAWTNDTTRATALVRTTTGTLTKSGDLTRRYVGSMRTTTVAGQTEDSAAKRFLWNYYNEVRRPLKVTDTTDTWSYNTATWRQANANAANQVAAITGFAERPLTLTAVSIVENSAGNLPAFTGIGQDSTTAPMSGLIGMCIGNHASGAGAGIQFQAYVTLVPTVGYHTYVWLERGAGGGVETWYGDGGGSLLQSGLFGWVEG